MRRKSLNYFLEKCNKIHDFKYDYSQVRLFSKNARKNIVSIICPTHGQFKQSFGSHIEGHGCKLCRKEYLRNKFKKSVEYYKNEFGKVHGQLYDYSLYIEHTNELEKIDIICKTHGQFKQSSKQHRKGHGCPKCANKLRGRILQRDSVVERMNRIHKNKYDYSLYTKHISMESLIQIICPEHGMFKLKTHYHLKGAGCKKCQPESKGEIAVREYLQFRGIKYEIQKIFTDLKGVGGGILKFDIFLPAFTTCIEFDGNYHRKPIRGIEALEKMRQNDNIKNVFCKKEGINLIRVNCIRDIPRAINALFDYPINIDNLKYSPGYGWSAKIK